MSLRVTQGFKELGGPRTTFGSTVAFRASRQYSRNAAVGGHEAAIGCLLKLGTRQGAEACQLGMAILVPGGAEHLLRIMSWRIKTLAYSPSSGWCKCESLQPKVALEIHIHLACRSHGEDRHSPWLGRIFWLLDQ